MFVMFLNCLSFFIVLSPIITFLKHSFSCAWLLWAVGRNFACGALIALAVYGGSSEAGTVLVDPEVVFDAHKRTHSTTVINSGSRPVTYTVSIVPMYQTSDQKWRSVVVSTEGMRQLAQAFKFSPQRFQLRQNTRQIIRLRLVNPHLLLPQNTHLFVQIKEHVQRSEPRQGLGFDISLQHRLPIRFLQNIEGQNARKAKTYRANTYKDDFWSSVR